MQVLKLDWKNWRKVKMPDLNLYPTSISIPNETESFEKNQGIVEFNRYETFMDLEIPRSELPNIIKELNTFLQVWHIDQDKRILKVRIHKTNQNE